MKKKINIILFLLIGFTSFSQEVLEVSDANILEKVRPNNNKVVIIDFYATWCGPCRRMDPILKEIAKEYQGQVEIYKIDVDRNSFDNKNGVNSYPTYFFYKNGQLQRKEVGAIGKKGMIKALIALGVQNERSNNNYDPYITQNNNESNNEQLSDSNLGKVWNDWNALNTVAWKAYEANVSGSQLNQAIKAIQRSIQLNSNYYNHDTYAALLYLDGKYVKSLKEAKKAISKAKYSGINYAPTNDLIFKAIDKL